MPNNHMPNSPAARAVEAAHGGRPLREIIREGVKSGSTYAVLAEDWKVSTPTVKYWLLRCGLQVRKVAVADNEQVFVRLANGDLVEV